jgi:hypothetical protein
MEESSKSMHVCDKEVLCELLQDSSDISESESGSDNDMNVKISSSV